MKFPNPHKKMAEGFIHQEGGPQHTEPKEVMCVGGYMKMQI